MPPTFAAKETATKSVETKKYHNAIQIRAAFRSQTPDALREALVVLRNQLTIHHSPTPIAPNDERLLLAQHWLESDPGAGDLFHIWETTTSTLLIPVVLSLLATTLRLLSFHYPFHPHGHAIIKTLLTSAWTVRLNNSLAGSHTETILVVMKLYCTMSDFAGGKERKGIMEAFPWNLKSLPRLLNMRRKGKAGENVDSMVRPDIRTLYLLFLISFISPTSSSQLKASFLEQHRDAVLSIFKGMVQDHYSVVRHVLEVLWTGMWSDSKLKRTIKISLFGESTLAHLVKLYARVQSVDDKTEQVVADVVHHFLLAICTHPNVGICFRDRGWYPRESDGEGNDRGGGKSKIYNKILANLLKTLQINDDPRQQELAFKILNACPELVSVYWPSANLTMEPRLSSKWIANAAFFGQVISLPIPTDSFFLETSTSATKLFNPSPPPLSTIMSNILPSAISPKSNFSKGLQSSNTPLVQHCTAIALCKALVKFRQVVAALSQVQKALDENELEGQWALRSRQVEEELRLRVPDFQVIVAFSQNTPMLGQTKNDDGNDLRLRAVLLSECSQRLQWLYHECLSDVVAEARFHAGKLLQSFATIALPKSKEEDVANRNADANMSSTDTPSSMTGLEAVKQLHVLRLLQKSDQFAWNAKIGGGASPTYFHILLELYTNPQTSESIRIALSDLLCHHLSQSILFQEDPTEFELWLGSLPRNERTPGTRSPDGCLLSDERQGVITFLDECTARCLKTPYRYIDEMAEMNVSAHGAQESDMWSGALPSPLLMTVLEQAEAKISRGLMSPSDVLSLSTFIRRLVSHLFSKQQDLRFLRAFSDKIASTFSRMQSAVNFPLVNAAVNRELRLLQDSFVVASKLIPESPSASSSQAVQAMTLQMESLPIPSTLLGKVIGSYEFVDYIRLVDHPLSSIDVRSIAAVLKKFHIPTLADFVDYLDISSHLVWQGLDLVDKWHQLKPLGRSFHSLLLRTSSEMIYSSECARVLVDAWHSSSPTITRKKQNIQLVIHRLTEQAKDEAAAVPFFKLLAMTLQFAKAMCPREDFESLKSFLFTHPSIKGLLTSPARRGAIRLASHDFVRATLSYHDSFDRSLVAEIASSWVLTLRENILQEELSDLLLDTLPWLPFNPPRILLQNLGVFRATKIVLEEMVAALSLIIDDEGLDGELQEFQESLLACRQAIPDSQALNGVILRSVEATLPLALKGSLSLDHTTQFTPLIRAADARWSRPRKRLTNMTSEPVEAAIVYSQSRDAWPLPSSLEVDNVSLLFAILDVSTSYRDPSTLSPWLLGCLEFVFDTSLSKCTRSNASKCIIRGLQLAPSVYTDFLPALQKHSKAVRPSNIDRILLNFAADLAGSAHLGGLDAQLTLLLDHGLRWVVECSGAPDQSHSEDIIDALVTFAESDVRCSPQSLETFLFVFARTELSRRSLALLVQACLKRTTLKPLIVNRVLQTVLQHADFFTLTVPSNPARSHIVDVIYTLFHLHPANTCQASHVEPLIALYRGTLSDADQKIFAILQLFEERRKAPVTSLFLSWSFTGTGSLSAIDAVRSLDPVLVLRTVLHGPVRRLLSSIGRLEEILQGSTMYDPVFLLLLVRQMLDEEGPDGVPAWVEVFRTNVFSAVVRIISYKDDAMRDTAICCLASLWKKLKRCTMVEKPQVLYTLGRLKNAIDSKDSGSSPPRFSSYTTLLIAHALRAIFYPSNMVYPLTSRFLLQRSELDVRDVPMLFSMLYSGSSDDWKKERGWIIRFLTDGMLSTDDFKVLKRRHTWDLLASLFQSHPHAIQLRCGILELLANLTCNSYAVNHLILKSQLLSWIECQLRSIRAEEVVAFSRILENILVVADVTKMESATIGLWRQSICRSLLLLIPHLSFEPTQLAVVHCILCQVIHRLASLPGPPLRRLPELLQQASIELVQYQAGVTLPNDESPKLAPWKVLPPHTSVELHQVPELLPFHAWGLSVTMLWQACMTLEAKPDVWDVLTPRLLIWRALVGAENSPMGEFARREVVKNIQLDSVDVASNS